MNTNIFRILSLLAFVALFATTGCDNSTDDDTPTIIEPITLEDSYSANITLTNHNPDGVDYIATGRVEIYNNAIMTVEAGVTIQFIAADAGLLVYDGAALVANGSSTEPITMTNSIASKWKGISLSSDNTATRLNYCILENSGSQSWNVVVDHKTGLLVEGYARITNTTVKGSDGVGITIWSEADVAAFNNNTIQGASGYALRMDPEELENADMGSCTFTSNGTNAIQMDDFGGIDHAITFGKADVPYHIFDNLEISSAGMTIEAGANLKFGSNALLQVYGNNSFLRANGTASDPIVLEGINNTRGYWKGVAILSNNTNNVLEHATIQDGGSDYAESAASYKANLTLGNSNAVTVTLDNVALNNSAECGICKVTIEPTLTFNASNLSYSNNVSSDICE